MNDVEAAERAGRKRARLMTASAALSMVTQAASFDQDVASRPEHLRFAAWIVWAGLLLLLLAGVGGWALRPRVRELLDDEVTRENRRRAMAAGFWAAMGTATVTYVLAVYGEISAPEAARLVLTFGIAFAVAWFARLERRGYDHG